MGNISTIISDGTGFNGKLAIRKAGGQAGPAGAIVYTEPRHIPVSVVKPFVNPVNGFAMNVNAAFGGTPVEVHDGADTVAWTATALSGTWTFNSTDQANTGTRSIDATATVDGSEAQFASTTLSTGSYVAYTGFIYITGWSTTGIKDVQVELRLNGTLLGNFVNLSNYINDTQFNVWQKFIIPMEDFGVGTTDINQVRVRTIGTGGGPPPNYYLDDMQFEESGGAVAYSIEPTPGKILEITSYGLFVAGTYNSTVTGASVPNLAYDSLLGVSLTNGIISTISLAGDTFFAGVYTGLGDWLSFLGNTTLTSGGNATTSWFRVMADLGANAPRLDSRTKDRATLIVSDDLSSLARMEFIAFGNEYTIGE